MRNESDDRGLVSAALEIAMRRKAVLVSLRDALELGDNDKALQFARQLCGPVFPPSAP
jgi:hypothetical protein